MINFSIFNVGVLRRFSQLALKKNNNSNKSNDDFHSNFKYILYSFCVFFVNGRCTVPDMATISIDGQRDPDSNFRIRIHLHIIYMYIAYIGGL